MRYFNDQKSFTPLREAQMLSVDEETRTQMKQFRPIWPLSIYPCQSIDLYGTRFPTLPNLMSKKIQKKIRWINLLRQHYGQLWHCYHEFNQYGT